MITIKQFVSSIEDWDIHDRAVEKAKCWHMHLSPKKMKKIPIKFISLGMVYFFMINYTKNISNYSQDMLMTLIYQLKQSYNQLSIKLFKKCFSFELTMVIMIKLYYYFISNIYHHLTIERPILLQQQLYTAIIKVLIGFEMDSQAFQILQNKYLHNVRKDKKTSSVFLNQIYLSQEAMDKAARSTKKLRRKGIQNLYKVDHDKNLENFKFQVHQALHINKKIAFPSKQPNLHRNSSPKMALSQCSSKWVKGDSKILLSNQVSAAISMHEGIDLNNGTFSKIKLSKKKQLKEFIINVNERFKKDKTFIDQSTIVSKSIENASKSKINWNNIIGKMKQYHKSEVFQHQSKLSQENEMPNYPKLSLTKPNKYSSSLQSFNKVQNQPKPEVEFMSTKGNNRILYQTENVDLEQSKWKEPRNSNSIYYTKERSQFQKKCQLRKCQVYQKFINLPKIDKN